MGVSRRTFVAALCALVAAGLFVTVQTRAQEIGQASTQSAFDTALGYLHAHKQELGLTGADLNDVIATSESVSDDTGVTHVYLLQRYKGIDVAGTETTVNIDRNGRVINALGTFVGNLPSSINRESASRGAIEAADAAARKLNLKPTKPFEVKETKGGPANKVVLSDGGIASDGIPAKLVYQPVGDRQVRLAWQVEIEQPDGAHWWVVTVDAETADVLRTDDLVVHDDFGVPVTAAATAAAATMMAAGSGGMLSPDGVTEAYRVYAWPKESANDGPRTLEIHPADPLASPFGWHDTNGVPGAESTLTLGNNVQAYTDLDANNVADPGSSPDGGADLVFDFLLDLTQGPETYRPAAVTNLFYWNNIVHDVFYHYGFTEPAGNFQQNNYGKGGLGNDYVRAEAQDGSGTNNANFSTPVDGSRPRMQMFVWTSPLPNSVIVNGGPIAGSYNASAAAFGPPVTTAITGDILVVNDGAGVAPGDGCEAFTVPAGMIPMMDRGNCNFTVKVKNAQVAGASVAIVANNVIGDAATMGGTDATVTIPSVMVSLDAANAFKANLPLNVTVQKNAANSVNRDSDMDAGVIAHEYTHGISNRLTGGPAVVNCLNNNEQMGEGWSDFTALVITAKSGQTPELARGIGTYVSFQPGTGRGIRPTPYTTDMTVNPTTYNDIKTLAVPHGVGYAWNSMLWEVYWNLVQRHGFNPDIRGAWTTGGNNLAIQLVIDGMKLQVCRPGFVDGRNAILLADTQLTGGANQCLIWKGFAKRGLGYSANQGSSSSVTDGTQAFDLPPLCQPSATAVPPSLASTQTPNTSSTQSFEIKNGSAPDGADLTWTITETASSCATPTDLPWVSVTPAAGTTAAAGATTVQVTFDSTGLGIGTNTGKLCISTNSSSTPVVEVPVSLTVIYALAGFFPPLANLPMMNAVNAGSTVPIKFNLGAAYGMDIFAAGFPASQQVDCSTLAPMGGLVPALAAGNAGLNVGDPATQYVYPWKTDKAWANSCREFVLGLNDGTDHRALFSFK